MNWSKIFKPWTWFDSKDKPAAADPLAEEAAADQFEAAAIGKAQSTTDLSMIRSNRVNKLNQWIIQNVFQKTHADIAVAPGVNGVTMDSSINTMDSSDIKSAYSLSGDNLPQVLFSWFVQQGFIGYQACAVIAQQWLVDKACRVPAEDAVKNGYDLTVNDGSDIDLETIQDLRDMDKQYRIHDNLVSFSRFNRVFGIRIVIFKVDSDDKDYYVKPFNIDGVKPGSYKGIAQVDPYWITPELDSEAVSDPSSPNFYEPTYWRISGKRYHRSHLIVIRHSEVADVLKPSYLYGGVPLTQMIYERVYAAERTANEAPQLALTKRTNVVRTDTAKAIQNQESFEERLHAFNQFRDNYGVLAIDKEEEFDQTDTTLTDLDNLIMTQYQLVAAIACMPATKLLGTSPKGFQSTGEFETETYYDLLECIQGDDSKLLERHYQILIKSKGLELFNFEITWKPLKSSKPQEIADINQKNATTDQLLQVSGAIDGSDIRNRIISDPNSGYNGLESFDTPDEEKDPGVNDG